MPQPFVGEIRTIAFGWAPTGWVICDGQSLAIAANQALFQRIGTTYGGDGQTTFNVPDLRGRTPIHVGQGHVLAQKGGIEFVVLTTNQLPAHTHALMGSTAQATTNAAAGNVPATMLAAGTASAYGNVPPLVALSRKALERAGGDRPHENRQPFLTMQFVISRFGKVAKAP